MSSDWLDQPSNILVQPSTAPSGAVLLQSDIDAKLAAVADGGWTVGIGLFKVFESSDANENILLASAIASVETEVLVVRTPEAKSEQQRDQSNLATNPIVIGASIAAIGLWHLRERKKEGNRKKLVSLVR